MMEMALYWECAHRELSCTALDYRHDVVVEELYSLGRDTRSMTIGHLWLISA
jgi:hypothetical protein